jgi:hypothetical protein
MASGRKKVIFIESDYFHISCTPDHKIFTFNRGWVKAENICVTDSISPNTIMNRAAIMLLSGTEGSGGFKKQVDTTLQEEQELLSTMESIYCIDVCGPRDMALYLMGMLFTMSMAIGGIIAYLTLSARIGLSTYLSTSVKGYGINGTGKILLGILKKLKSQLRCGTLRKKVSNGTESMPRRQLFLHTQVEHLPARHALKSSATDATGKLNTVQIAVVHEVKKQQNGAWKLTKALSILVRAAVRRFATSHLGVNAKVRDAGVHTDVYCPTLNEVNVFYANGVLVANCADSIALACYRSTGVSNSQVATALKQIKGSTKQFPSSSRRFK